MKTEEAVKILREAFGNVTVMVDAKHQNHESGFIQNWVEVTVFTTFGKMTSKICTTLEQCVQEHIMIDQDANNQHVNEIIEQVEQMAGS